MHDGNLKPEDLNSDMIRETYRELNDGFRAGYGKDFLKVNKDTGAPDMAVLKMQQNLYKFSGAKTFVQLQELNSKLVTNGRRTSWDDFRNEALKINNTYNINHLQAEWQTANQAAQHAANWEEYVRNKKRYPNLKYRTQNDDRVRPEHQLLNGIIAPIDSPFWQKYYPPNGWRCRCYVEQTNEPATKDAPEEVSDVKKEFRINVGEKQQVFNERTEDGAEAHSYFQLARELGDKTLNINFELSKLDAPLETIYKADSGARVDVSIFADSAEFQSNFKAAVKIADDLGFNVQLRPHLNGRVVLNRKNPEYLIDDKVADRKTPTGKRVSNLLSKSDEQGCEVVVFDLQNYEQSETDLLNKLKRSLSKKGNYENIKEVIILPKKGKAKHYKRSELK